MTGLYDVNAIGAHLALAGLITVCVIFLGVFMLVAAAIGTAVWDVARAWWHRFRCAWCRGGPCGCDKDCGSDWCCARELSAEDERILRGEKTP